MNAAQLVTVPYFHSSRLARLKAIGVFVLSAFLLSGCAQLEVKVDIYRGALANPKESQVRQIQALSASIVTLVSKLEETQFAELKGLTAETYGDYKLSELNTDTHLLTNKEVDAIAVFASIVLAKIDAIRLNDPGYLGGKSILGNIVDVFVFPTKNEQSLLAAEAAANLILSITDEMENKDKWDTRDRALLPAEVSAAVQMLLPRQILVASRLAIWHEDHGWGDKPEYQLAIQKLIAGEPIPKNSPTDLYEYLVKLAESSFPEKLEPASQPISKVLRVAVLNAITEFSRDPFSQDLKQATRADVVDTLLAALYYRFAAEAKAGSTDQNLKAAINALESRRLLVTRVPPPGAILRSTSQLPALQHEPRRGVGNRLWGQLVDVLPMPLFLKTTQKDRFENVTKSYLDAAQWQTVNLVRLRATGDLNYVLVKDDIGNWYVKTYTADNSDLFNTLANVGIAKFSKAVSAAASAGSAAGATESRDVAPRDKLIESLYTTLAAEASKKTNDKAVYGDAFHKELEAIHSNDALDPLVKEERYLTAYKLLLADLDENGRKEASEKIGQKITAHFKAREDLLKNEETTTEKALLASIP